MQGRFFSSYFPLSQEWRKLFNQIGKGHEGISFEQALELILYHPHFGYYTKEKKRVGKAQGTDFYTATSLGPIWSKLLFSGIAEFVGKANAKQATLLEIGSEEDEDLFSLFKQLEKASQSSFPFSNHIHLRINELWPKPKGSLILFSNELLDAQTFRQFRFLEGQWQEWGLFWDEQGLYEGPLQRIDSEAEAYIKRLPKTGVDGYRVDFPSGAERLLKKILSYYPTAQYLVFFDYGKYWDDLLENCPEGTARAYYRHQQLNSLWTHLGEQDITHHIVWEPVQKILNKAGFSKTQVLRQESFFVHYAQEAIQSCLQASRHPLGIEYRALQALLHPAHFGQRFQVLLAQKE